VHVTVRCERDAPTRGASFWIERRCIYRIFLLLKINKPVYSKKLR
jgi:hypothetical protein